MPLGSFSFPSWNILWQGLRGVWSDHHAWCVSVIPTGMWVLEVKDAEFPACPGLGAFILLELINNGGCGRNAEDLCRIFYFNHFLSSFVSSDVDFSPCFLSVSAALHPRCQLELGGAARSSSAFVALFYRTIKPLFWCAELTLCPRVSGFNSSDSFPSQHHQPPWKEEGQKLLVSSLQGSSCASRAEGSMQANSC